MKILANFSLAVPPQLIRLCQTVSFVFLEKQIDLLPAGYKFLSWPSGQGYSTHLSGAFYYCSYSVVSLVVPRTEEQISSPISSKKIK